MQRLLTGLMWLALFGIVGCANTAQGARVSNLSLPETIEPAELKVTPARSDALVTLRYPAYIDPSAESAFVEAFIDRAIGGTIDKKEVNRAGAERVATSLIAKTNFFALLLYGHLRDELPENSVLLSPHIITLDASGRLTSAPLMQSETLPSVLTVDFAPYSFPDPKQIAGKPPQTYGDLLSPLLVVHTDHRAKPETYGLVMASDVLLGSAFAEAKIATQNELDALARGERGSVEPRRLDLIAYLDGVDGLRPAESTLADDPGLGAVQVIPTEKIRLPAGAMTTIARQKADLENASWTIDPRTLQKIYQEPPKDLNGSVLGPGGTVILGADKVDPLKVRYSEALVQRIILALNSIDLDRATLAARIEALSRYDEEVAGLYLSGLDNVEVRDRLDYAEKLLEAERKYITARGDALYESGVEGRRGLQMRSLIVEEWNVLTQRRQLADEQLGNAVLAIAAAAAGIYFATQAGTDPCGAQASNFSRTGSPEALAVLQNCRQQVGRQIDGNALGAASAFGVATLAGLRAQQAARLSEQLSNNALTGLAPAFRDQVAVQIDLIEGTEEISAGSFEEFREQVIDLYADQVGDIGITSSTCVFAQSGVWTGECANGQANGRGRGYIAFDDGGSVEYYGEALNGLAHGTGYRITLSSDGTSSAVQGEFRNGSLNGAAVSYSPGLQPKTSTFENGVAVIPDTDAVAPTLFDAGADGS